MSVFNIKSFHRHKKGALNIIVHGTWNEGTDTLARYAPFAKILATELDITTIAVALTGYSGSSTNKFPSLSHKGVESLGAKKEYVEFLGALVEALKTNMRLQNWHISGIVLVVWWVQH